MDDFERAVAESRDCAHLPFDDQRSSTIRAGIERKRRRRRGARTAALTTATAAVAVIAIVGLTRRPAGEHQRAEQRSVPETNPQGEDRERMIRLTDGSTISTSGAGAEVRCPRSDAVCAG